MMNVIVVAHKILSFHKIRKPNITANKKQKKGNVTNSADDTTQPLSEVPTGCDAHSGYTFSRHVW